MRRYIYLRINASSLSQSLKSQLVGLNSLNNSEDIGIYTDVSHCYSNGTPNKPPRFPDLSSQSYLGKLDPESKPGLMARDNASSARTNW